MYPLCLPSQHPLDAVSLPVSGSTEISRYTAFFVYLVVVAVLSRAPSTRGLLAFLLGNFEVQYCDG